LDWSETTPLETTCQRGCKMFSRHGDKVLAGREKVCLMRFDWIVLEFIFQSKFRNSPDVACAARNNTANDHVYSAMCAM